MSASDEPPTTPDRPSETDVVEANYDLLTQIANTALPVSDRCQRVLDAYEADELDD